MRSGYGSPWLVPVPRSQAASVFINETDADWSLGEYMKNQRNG